ncbi:N-acetylmuramoyl-L-alanine amidase family protein [Jannaschia ovalis]|uniref:N-acetylmuramoyl-L-alanine amidase n=1 Tax=Jannaschia ovalis TaxID=3038773 RepID=A0ABY8LA28_9RHOB|nr:N-acetylmuramoyl-L-alanine amidase [Jannaschia sp. GRR-S6-38]WGH78205.1 N-acetylmuramoyl-L-alanine amidase [Jannaschia sp. GRR-S6-38]
MIPLLRATLLAVALALPAQAQDFTARAQVTAAEIEAGRRGAALEIALSQPVPWRVFLKDAPWRLILDTSEIDWSGLPATEGVATGRVAPGWSRLVLSLDGPARIDRAWMETGEIGAIIHVRAEAGEGAPGPLIERGWDRVPQAVETPARPRQTGDRPLVVALDPGHGGIDPGAERGGTTEAVLMLRFARELAEVLRREGHVVVLTRESDEFVGLRGRSAVARAAGADLMISLHADALDGGGADGASVYTLDAETGEGIAAELAARQGRGDLLLGVELEDRGDEIAQVLIDLARAETAPRADALADALVAGIGAAGLNLHTRPRLGAEFTVLKAPDIPSVLLELGFMSDEGDLQNLLSPDWRARMATAIARGIEAWAVADAAEALRLRR